MKIRNGFVSNSSTSSFIILTTKENHEAVMAKADPYMKAVLKEMGQTTKKAFGRELIGYSTWANQGCTSWDYVNVEIETDEMAEAAKEYGEDASDAFYKYIEMVKETNPDEVLEVSGGDE